MELLKISDNYYMPIHSIVRINRNGVYMFVYYQRGTTEDYARATIKDDRTLEQELQSRLINIDSTKGFINAI